MPTKVKLKIQACFTFHFKFWENTSVKSYKIQLTVLLFLVSYQFLYQLISYSYIFLGLHSTLSEKDFCRKFSVFNGFTQTSQPLSSQNLQSVTKVFYLFFLKCLLIFFLNICWQNSAKASSVNCYCTYIFKDSNYRFSGVLFRTYFKNSYFNTNISNYWFYMFSLYYFIFQRLIWKAISVYFLWFHY